MRISDWSSDVLFRSDRGHRYRHERRVPWNDNPDHSDRLVPRISKAVDAEGLAAGAFDLVGPAGIIANPRQGETARIARQRRAAFERRHLQQLRRVGFDQVGKARSEEHTSELQSLMRISYAVFCLKKKKNRRCKP